MTLIHEAAENRTWRVFEATAPEASGDGLSAGPVGAIATPLVSGAGDAAGKDAEGA